MTKGKGKWNESRDTGGRTCGMDRNVERAGKGEQGDERQHEKGID